MNQVETSCFLIKVPEASVLQKIQGLPKLWQGVTSWWRTVRSRGWRSRWRCRSFWPHAAVSSSAEINTAPSPWWTNADYCKPDAWRSASWSRRPAEVLVGSTWIQRPQRSSFFIKPSETRLFFKLISLFLCWCFWWSSFWSSSGPWGPQRCTFYLLQWTWFRCLMFDVEWNQFYSSKKACKLRYSGAWTGPEVLEMNIWRFLGESLWSSNGWAWQGVDAPTFWHQQPLLTAQHN